MIFFLALGHCQGGRVDHDGHVGYLEICEFARQIFLERRDSTFQKPHHVEEEEDDPQEADVLVEPPLEILREKKRKALKFPAKIFLKEVILRKSL